MNLEAAKQKLASSVVVTVIMPPPSHSLAHLLYCRPAPHPNSSPLALFMKSKSVAFYTPGSAVVAAAADAVVAAHEQCQQVAQAIGAPAAPDIGGAGSSISSAATAAAASAGPAESHDVVALGCCDVLLLHEKAAGSGMHIDGDLLSYGFYLENAEDVEYGFGASAL
jgi:hypothetical protein